VLPFGAGTIQSSASPTQFPNFERPRTESTALRGVVREPSCSAARCAAGEFGRSQSRFAEALVIRADQQDSPSTRTRARNARRMSQPPLSTRKNSIDRKRQGTLHRVAIAAIPSYNGASCESVLEEDCPAWIAPSTKRPQAASLPGSGFLDVEVRSPQFAISCPQSWHQIRGGK